MTRFTTTRLTLLFCCALHCAEARMEQQWPIVILDEPIHLGNLGIPTAKHPEVKGGMFKQSFTLSTDKLPAKLYVVVTARGIVPGKDNRSRGGLYHDKVFINQKKVGVLNQGVQKFAGTSKIVILVTSDVFRPGQNELKVVAGSSASGKNLDDFDLHRIIIDVKE